MPMQNTDGSNVQKVYNGCRQRDSVARNDCKITIAKDPKAHSW